MSTDELLKTTERSFSLHPQTKMIILFSFLNSVRIINVTTFEQINWL